MSTLFLQLTQVLMTRIVAFSVIIKRSRTHIKVGTNLKQSMEQSRRALKAGPI